MKIKIQLSILNFLQFFAWGAWLLSAGAYMSTVLKFTGIQIGSIYATMGITSLFMPAIMGIVADRWVRVEKLFGYCHLILFGLFFLLTQVHDFNSFYIVVFFVSAFYVPTLALNNSLSYAVLTKFNFDIVKTFPAIRVWGTIGFIVAAWIIDLMGWSSSKQQFILSATASLFLGIYTWYLPKSSIAKYDSKSFLQRLGLDALNLFKNKRLLVFFIFSILLGVILQITNIWGVPFLNDFAKDYSDTFAVKHSVILLSLSQISETIFILTIPFFFKKYGIKNVILISMLAWIFRFGFFAIGNPEGTGLVFLIASMIIYGLAFDFFSISGSLFVEQETNENMRSSAQGLFGVTTGGLGFILGGYGSGFIVDQFTLSTGRDWTSIWFIFAGYALLISILFFFFFKKKE